jgi:hypothetical protein
MESTVGDWPAFGFMAGTGFSPARTAAAVIDGLSAEVSNASQLADLLAALELECRSRLRTLGDRDFPGEEADVLDRRQLSDAAFESYCQAVRDFAREPVGSSHAYDEGPDGE